MPIIDVGAFLQFYWPGARSVSSKKNVEKRKEQNRACDGPFENRAQMDSARSAASLRGAVL